MIRIHIGLLIVAIFMSESYFKLKTISIMVHNQAINKNILNLLPYWESFKIYIIHIIKIKISYNFLIGL